MGQLGVQPGITIFLLVTLGLAVTSCGGGSPGSRTPAAGGGPDGRATTDAEWAYRGLPDCEPLPAGMPEPPTGGLELPEGMVVTDVAAVDPLLQVTGLIAATPLQIRDHYASDTAVVHLEDEGFEAEVLLDRGPHRIYLRATIRCRTGSVISIIRAPGTQADSLPVPGQRAAPN